MCGIFAAYSHLGININMLTKVISELNHRGKDSYGISFVEKTSNTKIHQLKSLEKITKDNFDYDFEKNNIKMAITHNRYSTNKQKDKVSFINETQPLSFKNEWMAFDLAHNGNITNLNKYVENVNSKISDTQNIMNFFNDKKNIETAIIEFINTVHCSYSIVILTIDSIYAFKDRYGYKPLCLGEMADNICVSSEDCVEGFNKIKEILPGEIIKIDEDGYKSIYNIFNDSEKYTKNLQKKQKTHQIHKTQKCVFEYIYFMNKNTRRETNTIYEIRKNMGKKMAELETMEITNKNDVIVVGSPNTAVPMGIGYAEKLQLQYKQVLIKEMTCGRTFILKDQETRKKQCRKFIISDDIKNKTIILVDDSIVRGNTIQSLAKLFYKHGCKELHVRICSPELKYTCNYGIDIPTKKELMVNNYTIEEIEKQANITSLRYIDINSMISAINEKGSFCSACFDGVYNKELDW